MESYLDKIGIKEQLRQKKWLQKWPDVVGKHICRYAHPLFLKKGVLWVEVSDSNWLYHLTTLQPKIIADYNKIIGSDIIKSMKMINAGNIKRAQENGGSSLNKIEPYPVEPNRKKILLNLHERNRISNLVRSAPSSYRDRFCNLLNHFYLQQKARLESGAIPCRICGLPCYESEMNSKLCPICYRQALGWIESVLPLPLLPGSAPLHYRFPQKVLQCTELCNQGNMRGPVCPGHERVCLISVWKK